MLQIVSFEEYKVNKNKKRTFCNARCLLYLCCLELQILILVITYNIFSCYNPDKYLVIIYNRNKILEHYG